MNRSDCPQKAIKWGVWYGLDWKTINYNLSFFQIIWTAFFATDQQFSIMDYSPQSTSSSVSYNSTMTHTMSVADDVKTQHRQLFNPVTPDISPPPQIMVNGGFSVKSREAPVSILSPVWSCKCSGISISRTLDDNSKGVLQEKLQGAQRFQTMRSRALSIKLIWKKNVYLVAQRQKLVAWGTRAPLEHSPELEPRLVSLP